MKLGLILALGLCTTVNVYADELEETSQAPADLVTELHEFCQDMYEGSEENIQSVILACVNEQLDIAAYNPVRSLSQLKSSITEE